MACILHRLIFVDIVILANFHASLTCTIDETNELDTTEDPIVHKVFDTTSRSVWWRKGSSRQVIVSVMEKLVASTSLAVVQAAVIVVAFRKQDTVSVSESF